MHLMTCMCGYQCQNTSYQVRRINVVGVASGRERSLDPMLPILLHFQGSTSEGFECPCPVLCISKTCLLRLENPKD